MQIDPDFFASKNGTTQKDLGVQHWPKRYYLSQEIYCWFQWNNHKGCLDG